MRTTVTLDPDTEALLKEEVRRSGLSFKEILNRSVRKALGRRSTETIKVTPLFKAPFPMDVPAVHLNRVADELDDEATLNELGA